MLSKNNRNELIKKQIPKRQRFTLKKLTIGVASVLIGFTFMGISASADTTNANTQSTDNRQAAKNGSDNQLNTQKVVLGQSNDQAKAQQSSAADVNNATSSSTQNSNAAKADSSADTVTFNPNHAVNNPVNANEIAESKIPDSSQQNVSDWQSFISALEDSNIKTINITHDITVNGKTGNLAGQSAGYKGCLTLGNNALINPTDVGIARTLTIKGNGHTIDFGHY